MGYDGLSELTRAGLLNSGILYEGRTEGPLLRKRFDVRGMHALGQLRQQSLHAPHVGSKPDYRQFTYDSRSVPKWSANVFIAATFQPARGDHCCLLCAMCGPPLSRHSREGGNPHSRQYLCLSPRYVSRGKIGSPPTRG